jgi:hypothetical protein
MMVCQICVQHLFQAASPPGMPEAHAQYQGTCSSDHAGHTLEKQLCIPTWTLADNPLLPAPAAPSATNRKCKEVKCKKMTFKDGYGAQLDRNGACFDDQASVVVTITDSCPCHYPGNQYSNKRWCCG